MFLPPNPDQQQVGPDVDKRAETQRLETLIHSLIPASLNSSVNVTVQEIQCGDPMCSPIDTAIMLMFDSGGQGQMGLPMEMQEVTEEILKEVFPPDEILNAWHKGSREQWSPYDSDDDMQEFDSQDPNQQIRIPRGITLRFTIGDKVQCRTGEDPITGWGSGEIIQVWYRESNWPPGQMAPYKIKLDDGRNIFAPSDVPEVIRRAQPM